MDKRKGQNKAIRKGAENIQEENLLSQVLKIIEQLFEARLIEKIVRPIDRNIREQHINRFGIKFNDLHAKLKRIKQEVMEITGSENGNARNKSVFGEATNKPDDWKKIIRNIESKYTEVLTDAYCLNFKPQVPMQLINIEEWAAACLDTRSHDLCC